MGRKTLKVQKDADVSDTDPAIVLDVFDKRGGTGKVVTKIYALCPHCGDVHDHGGGGPDVEASEGSRMAHCDSGGSNDSYFLVDLLARNKQGVDPLEGFSASCR